VQKQKQPKYHMMTMSGRILCIKLGTKEDIKRKVLAVCAINKLSKIWFKKEKNQEKKD